MPVHLVRRDGKHCVAEPDGTIVPSGCYDKREDALARLRAINANVKGDSSMADEYTIAGSETTSSDSTTINVTIGDDGKLVWDQGNTTQELEHEVKENEKKFEPMFVEVGPTTFAELNEARESQKKDKNLKKILSDFMTLVGNVMSYPSENGKIQDIKELIKEMSDLMTEDEDEDEDEEETKNKARNTLASQQENNSAESDDQRNAFMIWKDESTGEYRWLGVYSNKFRDGDSPAEILAEKAHLRFIDRVEKGELEYPDLYIWHIPVPIGKADLLAYDDAGFSIASGTVEEDFAIALEKSSEDLAMSHGMPAHSIRRDDSDQTVITEYTSVEVSVLPRYAAANKMTDFHVLKEEEAKMAIIPDNKRQQVADLLGTELTEKLEAGLELQSDKAVAEGIEFKEEEQQVEETEAEMTEEKTEEIVEEAEVTEEPVAEAEDVAEESVESDAGAAEEVAEESATITVEKDELAQTLAAIVETMSAQNEQIVGAIKQINERIDNIEAGVGKLEKSDKEKVAELAASTPEASLQALLAAQLAGKAGSVIGNPDASVHGNNKLAKEGPEETPHEEGETEEGYAGLFFNGWR